LRSLELTNLSFHYREGAPVLKDLSLSLTDEDRLALTGPNGSGKTTLFRVTMGLLKPQNGYVALDGKEISDDEDWRRLRREVGMVFQDPDDQLFCPTLLEDVAFGPMNMGIKRKEAGELSLSTLRALGIEDLADRPPYSLSGGQKKLGALATVLSMSPSFILLDEPSAGLDDDAVERLITALRNFSGGYLIASHEPDFLRRVTSSEIKIGHPSYREH